MTLKIMLVGDTHGNAGAVKYKAKIARGLGVERMIILGDFGLWPGYGGVQYLDDVNGIARENNLIVTALPGNHEDHDQWVKWFDLSPLDNNRFAIVRSNLRLTKKVHPFTMGGKRWYVCGGAVSIDKQYRTEGKSWWKNEEFTEADLASVERYKGPPIDYLLTHDCSDHTEFGFSLKADLESKANRQRIDRAVKALRPRYHFHGHMHSRYEWINTRSHGLRDTPSGLDDSEYNGASTHTFGLECDYDQHSFVILDTGAQKGDQDKVCWPR